MGMPWSLFSECWALSQLFHSPLSLSSRGFLVPLYFLPKEWCHLHIWVNSRSWWWTGRPGMVQFIGLQGVGHDWVTEVNWTKLWPYSVAALLAKPLTCSGLYPVVWRAPSRKTSEMTEWVYVATSGTKVMWSDEINTFLYILSQKALTISWSSE